MPKREGNFITKSWQGDESKPQGIKIIYTVNCGGVVKRKSKIKFETQILESIIDREHVFGEINLSARRQNVRSN